MNARARFLATMNYQPRDRVPLIDFGFWSECFDVWRETGLPVEVGPLSTDRHFGMDGFMRYYLSPEATDGHTLVDRGMIVPAGLRVGLVPLFEERVLESTTDEEVVQLGDGIRVRRHKRMSSIPQQEGHLLVDRASWERHYRARLDPNTPDRYPSNWAPLVALAQNRQREHILMLPAGSLYGWIRNWMGLEGVSLLLHDEPALFEEMLETITACIMGVLERALSLGGTYDAAFFWEDVCYRQGPLLSPDHFRMYLLPRYQRITGLLRRYGVGTIIVDSDGRIDDLVPLWMDGGVNCLMPIEIGTTRSDPVSLRRRFGRDLRMIGGFDKRILAQGRTAIAQEITRLTPLVEEGGYIPTCDHKVPPDVPLANYEFFLAECRQRWSWAR